MKTSFLLALYQPWRLKWDSVCDTDSTACDNTSNEKNTHYPRYRSFIKLVYILGHFFAALQLFSGMIYLGIWIMQPVEYTSSGMKISFNLGEFFLITITGLVCSVITYLITRAMVDFAKMIADISDNLFKIVDIKNKDSKN